MPGDVPPELGNLSTDQIKTGARLLRALHDASLGFEALGPNEVVCHGDASPCNCVFRDGLPYAFIDFDAAHAGDRREDIGYAAWLWLDIGNADLDPFQQGRRLGEFVAAYDANFLDAVSAVIDAQTELSRRHGAPPSTRGWATQSLEWSNDNRVTLYAGVRGLR
jgi:aminoglycoside phosphotransferase